jgi:hypothetical protein
MAIVHYDVVFKDRAPNVEKIKERLEERTGLKTQFAMDALDKDLSHSWPHIGKVKESGTLECDEADDSDLELTVGSTGVRISFVATSINPYFRDSTLAALIDLGGKWDARLPPMVGKKWSELSRAEKQIGGHH